MSVPTGLQADMGESALLAKNRVTPVLPQGLPETARFAHSASHVCPHWAANICDGGRTCDAPREQWTLITRTLNA
jgi:hypothetical protein